MQQLPKGLRFRECGGDHLFFACTALTEAACQHAKLTGPIHATVEIRLHVIGIFNLCIDLTKELATPA